MRGSIVAAEATCMDVFRTALTVFFVVIFPIGIYHRVSSATSEKLDRRQEGVFILATLRPVAALFWLGTFAWMIDPGWMAWSSMRVPLSLRYAGIGVLALAGALFVWTFRSLGKNLTDTVVTRQESTLVAHGPYRWIRHPLYTTVALLTIAISLLTANWFLLIVGPIVFALLVIRTRTEEANLVARFGERYSAYMQRTGRFLPRVGSRGR
jgi:protein-S-isoprenylcysteine O-methyltransferase Ste14